MKVWMVSAGRYSDYGIVGIFSTKEKADAFVQRHQDITGSDRTYGPDLNGVEEVEVDAYDNGMVAWTVLMQRDGAVLRCTAECWDVNTTPTPSAWVYIEYSKRDDWHAAIKVDCWARDREHAIKIANERRIMRIANEQNEGRWFYVTVANSGTSFQTSQEAPDDRREYARPYAAASGTAWHCLVRADTTAAAEVRARELIEAAKLGPSKFDQ